MSEFQKRILRPLSLPLFAAVFVGILVISLSRVLLAVPEAGSTLIALLVAAEVLGIASVIAATTRIKPAQRVLMLLLGLALVGGGGASASIGVRKVELAVGVPVPIAAKGTAFTTNQLQFPVDTKVSLHFSNDDVGIQHNVAIFKDDTLSTLLFRGALVTGPASIPYAVPPLPAGTYYFHCDVHPQQMHGTITVGTTPAVTPSGGATTPPATASSPPPAAGGAVTSLTVVARGLNFDVTQFVLKANSQITLTLDNQDPGIPHNLAILTTENGTVIFRKDPFSGPAKETWTFTAPAPGTYFFHCEVHSTMKGTVIVK
ncbi:MAG: cupredoxin domain-containing protein [Actinomycetota bacterium]